MGHGLHGIQTAKVFEGWSSPIRKPVQVFGFSCGAENICLGKEMPYIQIKSVVASILRSFELEMVEKSRRPETALSSTLRMKHGLAMRVGLH